MSPEKNGQAPGDAKSKKTKSHPEKKTITPEKLVSTINRQNEALNNIIKKFSEPEKEKDVPAMPKKRIRFKKT